MNLVGKIFTVLIFVMSILFSGFAVAVYATHRNWRELVMNEEAKPGKPVGYIVQLKAVGARNQELKDQLAKLEGDLAAEKLAKAQAVAKLETENEELRRTREDLEKKYAELVKSERDAVGAMKTAQDNMVAIQKELDLLRVEVRQAQTDRDAHFKEVVRLTDELHQSVNEVKRLKERQVTLAADLAKADKVLRHFDLNKDIDISGVPPRIDGIVLAVPSPEMVEISIGSDDGLMKGHRLDVYRVTGGVSTYVGKIEVVKTTYDRSACKVIPEFRQSPVLKGDRVATKLQ